MPDLSSGTSSPSTRRPLARCLRLSLAVLVPLLAACAPQPLTVTREPVHVQVVAADSCGPLARELAAAYEEVHPWVTVDVEMFNAAVAEETLRAGEADLALLSWLQEDPGEGELWSTPFARDGVAVIAHPATPLPRVDRLYLQEIFRGRIQEWDGTVLTVVSREEGSGTRSAFDSVVLDGYDVTLTAVVMPSSEAVVEYVSTTPGAIGYVSTFRMTGSDLQALVVVPVDGVLPTREAVSDGSYLLWRSLYLATIGEPAGEVRELAQWILGPAGQVIVAGYGSE